MYGVCVHNVYTHNMNKIFKIFHPKLSLTMIDNTPVLLSFTYSFIHSVGRSLSLFYVLYHSIYLQILTVSNLITCNNFTWNLLLMMLLLLLLLFEIVSLSCCYYFCYSLRVCNWKFKWIWSKWKQNKTSINGILSLFKKFVFSALFLLLSFFIVQLIFKAEKCYPVYVFVLEMKRLMYPLKCQTKREMQRCSSKIHVFVVNTHTNKLTQF